MPTRAHVRTMTLPLGVVVGVLALAACTQGPSSAHRVALSETGTNAATATGAIVPTDTPTPVSPTVTFTPAPPTATRTPFPLPPPFTPIAGRPQWSPLLIEMPLRRGDARRPVVYLTFDDGYGYPDAVLAVLQQRRTPATACLIGQFIASHRAFVQHWLAAGDTLCNHSFSHPHLLSAAGSDVVSVRALVTDQISQTEAALKQVAPKAFMVPFFRPPYGEQNNAVREAAARLGYRTILWSLDPRDWRAGLSADAVRDAVVNNARNGDIIELHFERRSTVDALPFIIDGLRARGFTLLGLESLPSNG
jgi:peptidoglycan-N-acetylglucosamine deacetylase